MVELSEVNTKKILFLGVCHCAKRIWIKFLSPQIEVDFFQKYGIFISWTIFWVYYDVI